MVLDIPAAASHSRLAHIAMLRRGGTNPYPAEAYLPTHRAAAVHRDADALIARRATIRVAGRLVRRRAAGPAWLIDVVDDDDRLCLLLSAEDCDTSGFDLLDCIDVGDFVGAEGMLCRGGRGETRVRVRHLTLLGKPLRGSRPRRQRSDGETALRRATPASDDMSRSRIVLLDRLMRAARAFFHRHDFVDLSGVPGCTLKRAMGRGLSRVLEIGCSAHGDDHDLAGNAGHATIAWCHAWSDYREQMGVVEAMVAHLAAAIRDIACGHRAGQVVDLAQPWPRLRMTDAIGAVIGGNPLGLDRDELITRAERISPGLIATRAAQARWGDVVTTIFEALVAPTLSTPVFVIDPPLDTSPRAKQHRRQPGLAEQWTLHAAGMAIGSGRSELNDPIELRRRLRIRTSCQTAAAAQDKIFLGALDGGLPQAGGAELAIGRLLILLTDAPLHPSR